MPQLILLAIILYLLYLLFVYVIIPLVILSAKISAIILTISIAGGVIFGIGTAIYNYGTSFKDNIQREYKILFGGVNLIVWLLLTFLLFNKGIALLVR